MKIYKGLEHIPQIKNPVLTIGTFDGVHLGHQKIIRRLNEEAETCDGESVLFTFSPHPRMVLQPDSHGLKLLQTEQEKIEKLRRMGLKHLIIYPFTRDFSNTRAEDFIREYLVEKLHVNTIVVGYDHQFGKNREGSLEHLLKLSETHPFKVIEIPAHVIDEINVSSTKIRKAIETGDITTANTYLNEAFELSGTVVRGAALGRTIGFPTANVELGDSNKLIPATGVYAVEVKLESGGNHHGMMNIGYRPTVTDEKILKIEVHLFDFTEELYDQKISVYLLNRIRDEKRFQGLDELKSQIAQDELAIRTYFQLQ